ncbi:unnamed protein product [Caenorhabditis bovis]|uniref:Piwi domain-containing protein n=1 Tax=Caenorhabditis bovis TaxID=2654633 RepID=A0A8S1FDA1_9PELO|nr:unnamed protein product [Caenorhabditis bovis]
MEQLETEIKTLRAKIAAAQEESEIFKARLAESEYAIQKCRAVIIEHLKLNLPDNAFIDLLKLLPSNKVKAEPYTEEMYPLKKQLKEMSIAGSDPPMAEIQNRSLKSSEVSDKLNPASTKNATISEVSTNFWSIHIEKNSIVYRYDVNIELHGTNIVNKDSVALKTPFMISLTGEKTNECVTMERHKICHRVLREALDENDVFKNESAIVYDCATSMYTSKKIEAFDSVKSMQLTVPVAKLPNSIQMLIRHSNPSHFIVTITPNSTVPFFDISDFSNENPKDVTETSKIVSNFMDLLTNQSARENGLTVFGCGSIFDMSRQGRVKNNGHEERNGADKGIKFIEGKPNANNQSDTIPALNLDGVKIFIDDRNKSLQAFFGRSSYIDWNLMDQEDGKGAAHDAFLKMNRYVKGLKFEPTYDKHAYTCVGLTRFPMSEIKIQHDGKQISLVEYLGCVHNERGPFNKNLPAGRVLVGGEKKREMLFALETMMLLPNQRVPNDKQIEKPRPISVRARYNQMQQLLHDLSLDAGGANNKYLKMFGVKISEKPRTVTAIQRQAPEIIFKNKTSTYDAKKMNWSSSGSKLLRGASSDIVVLAHDNQHRLAVRDKWISNENMLIVSYDVAHPGQVNTNEAVMVPSVVGFSFNGASHKEAFIGDFHYQYPKREQVDSNILKRRMKWMIDKFVTNRRKYPAFILIIRDGVSEGQYAMVMTEELTAIRAACQEVAQQKNLKNWSPKFALVIATKRNSARFFMQNGQNIANVKPLTVIDQDITRSNINEAYIVSANAIQGTAKPICYQLLRNEIGFKNMDEFESFMLALTFHHQICESPISLPEPVYQADEFAKRGNAMWKAYERIHSIPKIEDGNAADFEFMTENLSYWHSKLDGSRINA